MSKKKKRRKKKGGGGRGAEGEQEKEMQTVVLSEGPSVALNHVHLQTCGLEGMEGHDLEIVLGHLLSFFILLVAYCHVKLGSMSGSRNGKDVTKHAKLSICIGMLCHVKQKDWPERSEAEDNAVLPLLLQDRRGTEPHRGDVLV